VIPGPALRRSVVCRGRPAPWTVHLRARRARVTKRPSRCHAHGDVAAGAQMGLRSARRGAHSRAGAPDDSLCFQDALKRRYPHLRDRRRLAGRLCLLKFPLGLTVQMHQPIFFAPRRAAPIDTARVHHFRGMHGGRGVAGRLCVELRILAQSEDDRRRSRRRRAPGNRGRPRSTSA
jgi:hypothetical protein